MRCFKIPYGKKVKDKIIAGILTPKQGIYMGSILVLFTLLFIANNNYIQETINVKMLMTRLTILIIYSIPISIISFKKKGIYDLDEYLILKIKYKIRNKKIIYEKY